MNTEQARAAAKELLTFAKRAEELMAALDSGSVPCDCCGTIRYNNWAQKQLADKLEGIAERLETAGDTLNRRADDPAFLGGGG